MGEATTIGYAIEATTIGYAIGPKQPQQPIRLFGQQDQRLRVW